MRAFPLSRVISRHFPSPLAAILPKYALMSLYRVRGRGADPRALPPSLGQGHALDSIVLAPGFPAVPTSPASPGPHLSLTSVIPSCPLLQVPLLVGCQI